MREIVIYPVGSAIQRLNNWGLVVNPSANWFASGWLGFLTLFHYR